jgi:hypothetical protein
VLAPTFNLAPGLVERKVVEERPLTKPIPARGVESCMKDLSGPLRAQHRI